MRGVPICGVRRPSASIVSHQHGLLYDGCTLKNDATVMVAAALFSFRVKVGYGPATLGKLRMPVSITSFRPVPDHATMSAGLARFDVLQRAEAWRRAGAALLFGLVPLSQVSAATPSFLLIDGGRPATGVASGCGVPLTTLHVQLDQAQISNRLLAMPDATMLRRAMLALADQPDTAPRVFVFCGGAATSGGRLFVLPAGVTATTDLSRDAVGVAAFSRLLGEHGGAVVLDLLQPSGDPNFPAEVAAWRDDGELAGNKVAAIGDDHTQGGLIGRLARLRSFSVDDLLTSVAAQGPPAAPPTPPSDTSSPPPPSSPSVAQPPAEASTAVAQKTVPPELDLALPDKLQTPSQQADDAKRPKTPLDETIRQVQVALLARGLFKGKVTGMPNHATRVSIRHFQDMIGHPSTGLLTSDETKLLTGG